MDFEGDRKTFPIPTTSFRTGQAKFSPDGRWIGYESEESGRREIWVQRFPGPAERTQVSRNGGTQVIWRGDGKELFYLAPDKRLMAVAIHLDPATSRVEVGMPEPLFTPRLIQPEGGWQYAVSPDGQRLLVDSVQEVTIPITLLLNWKPQ
jgi:Tol biopolymer transport system component